MARVHIDGAVLYTDLGCVQDGNDWVVDAPIEYEVNVSPGAIDFDEEDLREIVNEHLDEIIDILIEEHLDELKERLQEEE